MPMHCSQQTSRVTSLHTKPSPMPIESISRFWRFKSFHLHLGFVRWQQSEKKDAEKRIRVYYGCNSSVSAYFLPHRCRSDSVSCKSLFCAGLSLSLPLVATVLALLCEKYSLAFAQTKKIFSVPLFHITLYAYCVWQNNCYDAAEKLRC